MIRLQQVSANPEEILHRAVDRREALQLNGRLEAPQLALALAGGLMRCLGPVGRIPIRTVDHRRQYVVYRLLDSGTRPFAAKHREVTVLERTFTQEIGGYIWLWMTVTKMSHVRCVKARCPTHFQRFREGC